MDERPDPNAPDQDEGIVAYHGSPHDFDQFDLSKIGTGEGAQAYGHGLYFAENENIAKSYRDTLTRGAGNMTIEGRPFSEFHGSSDPEKFLKAKLAINMLHDDRDIQQAIDWQIQQTKGKLSSRRLLPEDVDPLMEDLQRLNQMKQSPPKIEKNPGHMYEVRINADPDKHFLDWDAPLSEQPEAIRRLAGWTPEWDEAHRAWRRQDTDNLLAELEGTGTYTPAKPPRPPAGALRASMRGEELYDHLHNKMGAADWPVDADAATRAEFRRTAAERVSQHLMDNGIRGIRYLDASSRGGTDAPTRNYVVFDDKHVSVRRKYEQGGAVQAMATGGEVGDETPYHQTPEFQNWFGGSVAHTDGVPTTYYHGTSKDKDYTSFNIGKHGLWLTADPTDASMYAEQNDSQGHTYEGGRYVKTNTASRVLPVHIKAENPYRGEKPEELFQKQNYKKAQSDWFEQLRSQGYDSWIPDSQKGSLAVVLKAPTQIKSIYNRSFDPKNKRMDKATGGEADQASDIPQIDNAVSVFPKPQRMFPEDAPVPGGMYLNAATKEDMTGHKAAMASIGVQPGGKPYFRASPDSVDETGTPGRGSAMAKTNLFKQKAGWKWAQAPEGHEATDTIVSVQHRGQHHYTLNAHFPKGVDLARYEKSPTEPRLRPTTQGNVTLGPQVGSILVRGKEHPVYEHVIVKSTGGEVSGKKTAGGPAVATLRRMSDPAVNEAIRVINRSGSSPRDAVTLSKRLLGRQ